MYKSAQPSLFTPREMALLYTPHQRAPWQGHSDKYLRQWCRPVRDRQRYEALVRQKFNCDYCGYLLHPKWFDVHHTSYDNLGYEEASDLIAVHRRCHRILEEAKRSEMKRPIYGCGCASPAAA